MDVGCVEKEERQARKGAHVIVIHLSRDSSSSSPFILSNVMNKDIVAVQGERDER